MNAPRVTVLMPVYNGESYLREAMDSILNQTFTDFEFLIINDGSTDSSVAIIESYDDARIRLVHNNGNLGLIATLNRGMELAEGEYIARMDCDDISLPLRLAKQVAFMDRHLDVGVCGTWYMSFGSGTDHVCRLPSDVNGIRIIFLFNSMIAHPTACIRRSIVVSNSLSYDKNYPHAEDYEFWTQVLENSDLANIPEILLYYRVHASQITQKHISFMRDSSNRVRTKLLQEMGSFPSAEELEIHKFLGSPETFVSIVSNLNDCKSYLAAADRWLCKLNAINSISQKYPEPLFTRMLLWRWSILWHLVYTRYGVNALFLLKGVGIRRLTKLGWFGLLPILRDKGVSLLEEARYQKRMVCGYK